MHPAGEGTWDGTIIPSAEAPETNLLKASDGTKVGNGKIYALAVGSKGVGFYKVAAEAVIPAGKCYIEYEGDANPAREFITIGDDTTTGIFDVQLATAQQPIYDLQGRIVQRSTSNVQRNKGLYIQNGKKVMVK